MPDVLVRDLPADDKAFLERYAAERNVSQAEVLRAALSRGIDALRSSRPVDRNALRTVAQDLRELSDPAFEDDAWS